MTTVKLSTVENQLAIFELALAHAGFGATDRANYRVIVDEMIVDLDEPMAVGLCTVLTDIAAGKLGAEECNAISDYANDYFVATAGIMQTNSKKLSSLISENLIGNTAFLILFMNAATLKLGLKG